jgi:membrane protein implicated in regulation of membrane protease activity
MFSIDKAPPNTGKATAAAAAAAVVACAACCIPLVTPLALTLLASLGVYSANDLLTNGWWLTAAALLVLSPLVFWQWRKRQQRAAPPACATNCSCKTADKP